MAKVRIKLIVLDFGFFKLFLTGLVKVMHKIIMFYWTTIVKYNTQYTYKNIHPFSWLCLISHKKHVSCERVLRLNFVLTVDLGFTVFKGHFESK